jgi:hypothetical protein
MNEKILLIGEDVALLTARALVLSEWRTDIATSLEASDVMSEERFDLVILGQLRSQNLTEALIRQVWSLHPVTSLLLIRFQEVSNGVGVQNEDALELSKPGWLRQRVAKRLIARRKLFQD